MILFSTINLKLSISFTQPPPFDVPKNASSGLRLSFPPCFCLKHPFWISNWSQSGRILMFIWCQVKVRFFHLFNTTFWSHWGSSQKKLLIQKVLIHNKLSLVVTQPASKTNLGNCIWHIMSFIEIPDSEISGAFWYNHSRPLCAGNLRKHHWCSPMKSTQASMKDMRPSCSYLWSLAG